MHTPKVITIFSDILKSEFIATIQRELSISAISLPSTSKNLLHDIVKLNPEFILIDTDILDLYIYSILQISNKKIMNTKIIIYGANTLLSQVDIQKYNIVGFIQKDCSVEEFKSCLKSIFCGARIYLFKNNNHGDIKLKYDGIINLTDRELEVCNLIISKCTEKEIATILRISPNTVKVHKSNIINKLGIKGKLKIKEFLNTGIDKFSIN